MGDMVEQVVYIGKDIREKIYSGIQKLASAVKVTLGPKGRNVIIKKELDYYLTKDGVSVAKAVYTYDKVEQIVIDLMKDIALETNKAAGDGTTTAIIIAEHLLKEGIGAVNNTIDPIGIKKRIEDSAKVVLKELDKKATKIRNKKDLRTIATISANNNEEIGKLVADAIYDSSEDSIVGIKESPNSNTYLETVKGYTVHGAGYADKGFTNTGNKVLYNDVNILLVDGKLTSINPILPILEELTIKDKPVLIMATDFTDNVINILLSNKKSDVLKVIPIKTPGIRNEKKNILNDIATFTKSEILTNYHTFPKLGTAASVLVDKFNTTIVNPEANVNKAIELIKSEYEENKGVALYNEEKLKARISNLRGKSSVIYVGGNSDLEVKETIDRVEDAINATKAAKEEGVIAGGGIALYNIARDLEGNEGISKILIDSIKQPLLNIIKNARGDAKSIMKQLKESEDGIGYDAREDTIVNMKDNNILDPVKVTKEAVKNASAIASMLLTTEALVLNEF